MSTKTDERAAIEEDTLGEEDEHAYCGACNPHATRPGALVVTACGLTKRTGGHPNATLADLTCVVCLDIIARPCTRHA